MFPMDLPHFCFSLQYILRAKNNLTNGITFDACIISFIITGKENSCNKKCFCAKQGYILCNEITVYLLYFCLFLLVSGISLYFFDLTLAVFLFPYLIFINYFSPMYSLSLLTSKIYVLLVYIRNK